MTWFFLKRVEDIRSQLSFFASKYYLMKTFILILAVSYHCIAQQQLVFTNSSGNFFGKPRDLTTYINTEGNPYLLDDWREGFVFFEIINSKGVKLPKMRYNVLEELIEYEQNEKVFSLESKMFPQFVLLNGSDSLLFRNRIGDGTNKLSPTNYFQILHSGKNIW